MVAAAQNPEGIKFVPHGKIGLAKQMEAEHVKQDAIKNAISKYQFSSIG